LSPADNRNIYNKTVLMRERERERERKWIEKNISQKTGFRKFDNPEHIKLFL
jgi:hypothetical protein